MAFDKFALYWFYNYPRPERISIPRWNAMIRQYERQTHR